MERLTYWNEKYGCWSYHCGSGEAANRLAAYEETGLEPAMCANYKTFEDEAISKGVPFKRIVALMEADRAGRLAVLPCKCGADMKFWTLKKPWAEETAIEAWNRRADNG